MVEFDKVKKRNAVGYATWTRLDLHPHGPICFSGFFLRRLDVIPPHRAGVSLEIGFIHLLEKRKCLDG